MSINDYYDVFDVVPKDTIMNPRTEDLLFADSLANGMVVLLPPDKRLDEKHFSFQDCQTLNRWCEVTDLRFEEYGLVYFIGKYADGTKAIRNSQSIDGWIVKKDSIPVTEEYKNSMDPFSTAAKNLDASTLTTLSGHSAPIIRNDEPLTDRTDR